MHSFPPESLSWNPKENKMDFYNKAKKVLNSYKFAKYRMQIMCLTNSASSSAHKVLTGVLVTVTFCSTACARPGMLCVAAGLMLR